MGLLVAALEWRYSPPLAVQIEEQVNIVHSTVYNGTFHRVLCTTVLPTESLLGCSTDIPTLDLSDGTLGYKLSSV